VIPKTSLHYCRTGVSVTVPVQLNGVLLTVIDKLLVAVNTLVAEFIAYPPYKLSLITTFIIIN
jgi:hypothetical protein